MSALGDALTTKNREAVSASKIEIMVDSASDAATVTYSVRLEAPSYSEVLLELQTAEQVAAAVTEFTEWAGGLW